METIKNLFLENQAQVFSLFGYMVFEYILGVTNALYANSFLELLLRGTGRIINFFLPDRFVMAKKNGLRLK